MCVSDLHGGGLTVQRVLDGDLDAIGHFIYLSRFASLYPASARFAARSLNILPWNETDIFRKMVGCTQAEWLSQKPTILRANARHMASIFDRQFPREKTPCGLVCPQSLVSLYAVDAIVRKRPVEYLTWIMDDHKVHWKNGRWEYSKHAEKIMYRHLNAARAVIVGSPAMGEFYRERFGVDFTVLLSPADPTGEPHWEIEHREDEIRLAYFGAIAWWQIDALEALSESLDLANATLDLYTGDSTFLSRLRNPRVIYRGRVAPSDVIKIMRSYDAVVLPVSFTEKMRNMSQFNIATKTSECLASGTVTFLIGPSYSAMARYLENTGAALIATDPAPAACARVVSELRDRDRRRALLQSAANLVETELSSKAIRRIWEMLASRLQAKG